MQQIQAKLFPFPFAPQVYIGKGDSPRKKAIARDSFLPQQLT